jgi:hypothetical protein
MRVTSVIALVTLALAGAAAVGPAAAHPERRHGVLCQHQRGRTIIRRGSVRVLERRVEGRLPGEEAVFGCVVGSPRLVTLWEAGPDRGGSVERVNDRFVLVQSDVSNQYEGSTELAVFDLRSGASYGVGGTSEPLFPLSSYAEERPEIYLLARNGRTAILYEKLAVTVAPGLSAPATTTPTGQALVLLGFHHFKKQIASATPSAIDPSSISYNGQVISWTQEGATRSANT